MHKFRQLHCSFCGRSETEVLKLVAGQRGYICDQCVAIASQIMNDAPNNQPPKIQSSVWRKLLTYVRRFFGGDHAQRVSSLNAPI
jgi:ATP-dependent protease Clp ATPase subunit